ncbi:PIN domain-containing protein [Candidatus Poribacteria bacterium]|nr:PIN domain-containing protein [Candidatus Poribacteria bacterium]
MATEKRNFHEALEPVLYWDATFAIARLVDAERYHSECLAFEGRLQAGSILSVVSEFVHNELAFFLVKTALTEKGRTTGEHWLDVKRNRLNVIPAAVPEVEAKQMELDRMTLKLPFSETITEQTRQLMRCYSLLPTDAYHIAIALSAGVNAFVCLDEDFLRVDGIIVYTCLP